MTSMTTLSRPIDDIQESYDVVVIGSGYGGAIAASRLSRAGRRVCVLERGREFSAGTFPDKGSDALKELQVDAAEGHTGSQLGLYDLRINGDVSVLVGCGLGGTSLINASVAIQPDPRVFTNGRWPQALIKDLDSLLVGYHRAAEMLQPTPYPTTMPALSKLDDHYRSAVAMGHAQDFYRVPINVRFEDGPNAVGVDQKKCTLCGNCCSGCNYEAKNTLAMNYLPDALQHKAHIFTHACVKFIERKADQWLVHFFPVDSDEDGNSGDETRSVRADLVVLSAGALGSTEILLRSRQKGLSLSSQLGHHFSGNGDMLAFAYDAQPPANGIGWPKNDPPANRDVGPTITSGIYLRGHDVDDDVLIEEGAIPAPLRSVAAAGLATVATGKWFATGRRRHHRPLHDAAQGTQTYLVMSLDDGKGTIELDERDRPRVDWHGAGDEPDIKAGDRVAQMASDGIGGDFLRDPIWSRLAGRRLITVHPLGGCAMGDDGTKGVVNHACQVFAGDDKSLHPGLYVCDGSVLPSPLGVNPLFTISAIAERACAVIAESAGWTIEYAQAAHAGSVGGGVDGLRNAETSASIAQAPASATGANKATAVGIRFSEEMRGFFAIGAETFNDGLHRGHANNTTLDCLLTIESGDLDRMVNGPDHGATLMGTVTAPSLSATPFTVSNGVFNLFYTDPDRPGQRFMRYRMLLTNAARKQLWFDGFKHIGDDAPTAAYFDSRTLFVTLHDGVDQQAQVLARGRVQIDAAGITHLLRSFAVTGANDWFHKAHAALKFFKYFAGSEFKTYLAGIREWWHLHSPPGPVPADPKPAGVAKP